VVATLPFFQYRVNAVSGETFSRCKVSVGAQVIVLREAFVEHCLLLLLGHFWQFSPLDDRCIPTNVFHHASSPDSGKRCKLACSIGSSYSRQALGKSTAEPIFIFNPAGSPDRNRRSGSCRAALRLEWGSGSLPPSDKPPCPQEIYTLSSRP
jgi:hypothetical protein